MGASKKEVNTKRMVRFESLYTNHLHNRKGRGERPLMGKQTTFSKDHWALRRLDGNRDSL